MTREPDTAPQITALLLEAQQGREGALDEVMELVYEELRGIAGRQLGQHRGLAANVWQPTELAHEGFLRLIKQRRRYDNRGHFFAIASQVMLRVLMDQHRAQARVKRGGDQVRVSLSGVLEQSLGKEPSMVVPAFVEALEQLARMDSRCAEIVKLRLLWGLTAPEIAATLEVSLSTVEREWRFARPWLAAQLQSTPD
jgi:RNA polymerase sigma factor (TIGR02999 family)